MDAKEIYESLKDSPKSLNNALFRYATYLESELSAIRQDVDELKNLELGYLATMSTMTDDPAEKNKEITELKAMVNELRESLRHLIDACYHPTSIFDISLQMAEHSYAGTKEQSISAHDNKVIGRCMEEISRLMAAMVNNNDSSDMLQAANECWEVIRNLKTGE